MVLILIFSVYKSPNLKMMATMDLGAQGVDDEVSLQTENVLINKLFTIFYTELQTLTLVLLSATVSTIWLRNFY